MTSLGFPNLKLTSIIKRDGKSVSFNADKIREAIRKAFDAVVEEEQWGNSNISEIRNEDGTPLTPRVTKQEELSLKINTTLERTLEEIKLSPKRVTVENVQDLVEKSLMTLGHTEVAKAYIIYRNDHNQRRKIRSEIDTKTTIKSMYDESIKNFDGIYEYAIYLRTYAKWLVTEQRREVWSETVDRAINFFRKKTGSLITEDEYQTLRGMIFRHEIMPSMRLLQTAGPAAERENLCIYNCSFIAPTKLKHFCDIFYLSMCGVGIGFSCEEEYVNRLPVIGDSSDYLCKMIGDIVNSNYTHNHIPVEVIKSYINFKEFTIPNKTHVIGDSKEGWADALDIGLHTWYAGGDVFFDYSKIRPQGARLNIMGGRASGPEPLRQMLDFARMKIKGKSGSRLSRLEVHDIICKIGHIVVMGATRRSALISLSDLNDTEVRNCKKGSFWVNDSHRSMANNSAVYKKKPDDTELISEWLSLIESKSGERGIFNRGCLDKQLPQRRVNFLGDRIKHMGTNPCLTSDTVITTSEGLKTIEELVGKSFYAMVDGKAYYSQGFWSTGVKKVYKLSFINGNSIKATANHRFLSAGGWNQVQDIKQGDLLISEKDGDMNNFSVVNNEYAGEEEVFDCTVEDIHCFIANGLISHNCGEINLVGDGGLCNLSTIICRPHDDINSLANKIKWATVLGTIQSTFTDFHYVSESFKRNAEAERLLGVSATGQQDCKAFRDIETMKYLKEVAIKTNLEYAARLGISQSTAITTVKPEGTTSELVGAAPGCHPRYSKYYIRRVRMNAQDPLCKMLREMKCPHDPETGQIPPNVSTWVFAFPRKAKEGSVIQNEMSAADMFNYVMNLKKYYTEHNPSCTINVGDNEWIGILNQIRENWDNVGGLSFMPKNDHIYPLAPITPITEEEYDREIKKFNALNIDLSKLIYYEIDDQHVDLKKEGACIGGQCLYTP